MVATTTHKTDSRDDGKKCYSGLTCCRALWRSTCPGVFRLPAAGGSANTIACRARHRAWNRVTPVLFMLSTAETGVIVVELNQPSYLDTPETTVTAAGESVSCCERLAEAVEYWIAWECETERVKSNRVDPVARATPVRSGLTRWHREWNDDDIDEEKLVHVILQQLR